MRDMLKAMLDGAWRLVEGYRRVIHSTRAGQVDAQGRPICSICERRSGGGSFCAECEMSNNSW